MRILLLTLIIVFSACGGCSKENNATPNNANNQTDVGTDSTSEDQGPIVAKRVLQRRVPFGDLNQQNQLEDPNFGFQNDSWFASDNVGESVFVRRIYETETPDDRPVAAVLPAPSKPSCLIGRMKWTDSVHAASVWLSTDSGTVAADVTLIGLRTSTPAEWVGVTLTAGESQTIGTRNWTKYEATTPGYYGWGFFEICNPSDEVLYAGAPLVLDVSLTNAVIEFAEPTPVSDLKIKRIEKLFERK